MPKYVHYFLLLMVLMVTAGCETVKGAACGFGKDVHNIGDPAKNGWNALKRADAWEQQNLW